VRYIKRNKIMVMDGCEDELDYDLPTGVLYFVSSCGNTVSSSVLYHSSFQDDF
jgi:hypothetical protein